MHEEALKSDSLDLVNMKVWPRYNLLAPGNGSNTGEQGDFLERRHKDTVGGGGFG